MILQFLLDFFPSIMINTWEVATLHIISVCWHKAHVQILIIELFHAKSASNSFCYFKIKLEENLSLNLHYGRKISCFTAWNYSDNQFQGWNPFEFPISQPMCEKLKIFRKCISILEKYFTLVKNLEIYNFQSSSFPVCYEKCLGIV